jgi:hypothetical protein
MINFKNLISQLQEPFVSLKFYKKALNKSIMSSFFHLLIVIILMSGFRSLQYINDQYPFVEDQFLYLVHNLSQNYPETLIINWNGTELTANTDKISIPWPNNDSLAIENLPTQFLFFTNSQATPQELAIQPNDYLIFVNNNQLFYNDENQVWRPDYLANIIQTDQPLSISKQTMMNAEIIISDYVQNNSLKIKFMFFLLYAWQFIVSKLWFLFIETIFVLLFFKLFSMKLKVKQTISLSMHIMIPTVVLNSIAESIYSNINIPLQTITFWILIVYVSNYLNKLKK